MELQELIEKIEKWKRRTGGLDSIRENSYEEETIKPQKFVTTEDMNKDLFQEENNINQPDTFDEYEEHEENDLEELNDGDSLIEEDEYEEENKDDN